VAILKFKYTPAKQQSISSFKATNATIPPSATLLTMATFKKIMVVQPKFSHYRHGFWKKFNEEINGECTFIEYDNQEHTGLVSAPIITNTPIPLIINQIGSAQIINVKSLNAIYRQHKPDLLILPFDLNQLPSYFLFLLQNNLCLKCRIIGFGQLRSAFSSKIKIYIKALFSKFFHSVLLYTEQEYLELQSIPWANLKAGFINNTTGEKPIIAPETIAKERFKHHTFLTCSRLIPKNRIDLAILAFSNHKKNGGKGKLEIIGDGPLRGSIETMISNLFLEEDIILHGEIYEAEKLELIFNRTFFLIHPFAIGLSLNSAMYQALPIIACEDPYTHMPEFWLWKKNITGLGFPWANDDQKHIDGLENCLMQSQALSFDQYLTMSTNSLDIIKNLSTDIMGQNAADFVSGKANEQIFPQRKIS
jgi:glycosyltransferase involved in cell wall biosynthesis